MTCVVLVGNPRPQSRTLRTATEVAADLMGREPDHVIDLAMLGAHLLDMQDEDVAAALGLVRSCSLVVVASPTYKASFTGLLKIFLDRFGAGELTGIRAVPVMLGASPHHALAVEVHLRPVLVEIGLSTPTAGLFLIDSSGRQTPGYPQWLERAKRELSQ